MYKKNSCVNFKNEVEIQAKKEILQYNISTLALHINSAKLPMFLAELFCNTIVLYLLFQYFFLLGSLKLTILNILVSRVYNVRESIELRYTL